MSVVKTCKLLWFPTKRALGVESNSTSAPFGAAVNHANSRKFASLLTLCSFFAGHAQVKTDNSQSVLLSSAGISGKLSTPAKGSETATYLSAPLSFEPNRGQANADVRYVSHGSGYSLALTNSAAVLTLHRKESSSHRPGISKMLKRGRNIKRNRSKSLRNDVVRMELAGASTDHDVRGSEPTGATSNYFIGKDPSKWQTKVPNFASVRYGAVYPGVDLVYYGNQRQLEYDFIVAPHADPKRIKLHFSGSQGLKLDKAGNLEVIADDGEVVLQKPTIYQERNGRHVPVNGRFTLLADQTVGFKLSRYDHSNALIIDPTLSYATYLGGSTDSAATAIAADGAGNIYVIGYTVDTDFPITTGAFQTTNTSDNEIAFVTKLNAAGSALIYSTYLGGTADNTDVSGNDAFGLALDSLNSVYICGETYANDFPVTPGAFQGQNNAFANNAQNVFVSKLSPDGSTLAYSTYLGGSGLSIDSDFFDGDSPLRMTVDSSFNAYVVGTAYSTNFPTTTGAFQGVNKAAANLASNTFVTKIATDGKSLVYSTYLGGSGVSPTTLGNADGEGGGEAGYGITVSSTGNNAGQAYVTGYAFSPDFPVTANPYQRVNNGTTNVAANAFVTELNSTGTALVGSTYLGGSGRTGNGNSNLDASDNGDDGIGVTLDTTGNVYVVGVSSSTDFPTSTTAFQKVNNGAANSATNAFVSKLDPTLSTLLYSTYVGGSGVPRTNTDDFGEGDFATGIAVDAAGDAYIAGATESTDFPVTNDAFQSGPRSSNTVDSGFFTELNPGATGLTYSTYLGGSGAGAYGGTDFSFFEGDFFYDIALDSSANIYLTGYAYSYDFPITKNAFQRVNNAGGRPGGNAIIAKLGATAGPTYLPTTTTLSSTTTGSNITFTSIVKPVTGTGIPTGSATFYLDGVSQTTGTLDATGTATWTTNQIGDNLADVIATYSGDATYGASGSSLGQQPTTPGNTAVQLGFITSPTAAIGQGANGGTALVAVEDASGNIVTSSTAPITVTIVGPAGFTAQTLTVTATNGDAPFNFGNIPLTIPGIYSYTASSSGLISTVAFETVAPFITSISPNVVTAGSQALSLTMNGNFIGFGDSNDIVCFSGPSGSNSSGFEASDTSVSTTIPAGAMTAIGYMQVSIGNGDCTANVSNVAVIYVGNTLPATTATLAITPSPVAYGKPVTLTATAAQNIPVTQGQVIFCNLAANLCNAQFNLGSAQLNGTGVASLSIYPGAVGVHTYRAMFLGTTTAAAATSAAQTLTVTGTYPTATTLAATGNPGSYSLTSTVASQGISSLSPTGSISVIDQSNANAVLGTATLGDGVAAQTLIVGSGSPLTAGNQPYPVAAGDFNGDGFQDFAVANYGDGTVSVFLGNGDGTFKAQVTYQVGAQPEGIAAADMNGDGILDLVVTNTGGSSTVEVLTGKGDGTFPGGATYPAGDGASGIVIGDFNHDGRPDIAVSNYYGGSAGILLANQDGGFVQMVTYPVGSAPRTLATGDFNGDGILDLAVANQNDNTLSVLYGNGDGTFQSQILYPIGVQTQGLVVADFNGDGIPDLAFGNFGSDGVSGSLGILLGQEAGGFGNMTVYTAGGGPLDPVVADFNGDGFADIAIENFNDGTESLFLGNGDGTFQAQSVFEIGTSPYAAAVADFNGDGNPDLAISNFGSNNETILLDSITSTATATLTPFAVPGVPGNHNIVSSYPGTTNLTASVSPAVTLVAQGNAPSTTTTTLAITAAGNAVTTVASGTVVTLTATVDADGPVTPGTVTFCDAAATSCENSAALGTAQLTAAGTATLSFVPGIGTHSYSAVFTATSSFATSTSGPEPLTVTGLYATTNAIASSGTTGNYTLTSTVVGVGSVTVAPTGTISFLDTSNANASLGTATLGAATVGLSFLNSSNPGVGNDPTAVATGDFNGDGIPDLAVANYGDGANPSTVTVLLGKGDGTFTATAVSPAVGVDPTYIAVGDFNGDGKADLVISNSGVEVNDVWPNGTVTVLLGNGDGTFTPAATPTTGQQAQSIAVADFNTDGKLDMAVANGQSNTLTILLGNGDGTFTASASPATGPGPYGIATGDFNGDGIPDLATPDFQNNTVTVLLGNGDGTFTAAASPATGAAPNRVAIADFNGDGKADMAITNSSDNTLTVLLGKGDGTFTAAASPATGSGPYGINTGDFNGDGFADLAVTNAGAGTISILLGAGDGTFTALPQSAGAGYTSIAVADLNGDGVPDLAATNSSNSTITVLLTQRTQTATATLNNVSVTGSGTHNVEASYPGNDTFSPSTSPTTPLTGGLVVTALTLSANPTSSTVGQAVTLTADLNPYAVGNSVTDGEPITFSLNGTTLGTGNLTNGVATLVTTLLPLGANTLTATYAGDANFAASASAPLSYAVLPPPLPATTTTIQVTSGGKAVTTVAANSAVALIATVVNAANAPLSPGSVTFCDASAAICENSAILGTAQLTRAGSATITFVPGIGAHSYRAVFAGNNTNATSTSIAQPLTVSGTYPTATTLTSAGTPGNYTLTGTVAATGSASFPPAGTLSFLDTTADNVSLGSATLTPGIVGLSFLNSATPATGSFPYSVVVADFNNDGKADFAVANGFDNTLSIELGNGDGTFTPAASPSTGNGPEFLTVGDFNGDGKVDLAVANYSGNIITVLLGNGDGTFVATDSSPSTGNEPFSEVVADFNGDGNADLAVANQKDNTVTVLLGNGGGDFNATDATTATGTDPVAIAAGDFNRDGKTDLAVANYGDSTVTLLLGNGDGTFTAAPISPATGTNPESIATGDFNGDGIPDLAVANYTDGTVMVLLGKGDGTFIPATAAASGSGPYLVGVSDFNGDGKADVAVANSLDNTVSVLLGNGDGTFQSPGIATPSGGNPKSLSIGDFNGDGIPDVVTANANDNTATVLLTQRAQTATATLSNVAVTPPPTTGHSVIASYPGNTSFTASTSAPVTLTPTTANPVVLNMISPTGAIAGAAATTITAAGANFTTTSVVSFNTTALATTYVSATQLTAVVPAALIANAGTANITISDPFSGSTSQPQVFTILPGTPGVVTFSAPPTTPGDQPTLNFGITQPYPVDIAGTMTLTFTPDTGNPDNPQVQLTSSTAGVTVAPGGRSLTFPLAANSTAVPTVLVQVGNVSGTITITLQLNSAGVNVTPGNVTPITIVVPKVAPTISAVSFTTSGSTLTVLVTGYSTTREIQSATFNFTPASGATLNQKTITVPATTLFTTWYTSAASAQFGSAFTYTQNFTLSGNASAVAGVGATITNTVGTSTEVTAQ